MTPEDSTPEWFQMTQADGFEPKPKGKRALRIMALATPLVVLGAGLVFAQSQDSPSASASGVTTASSASPSAASSTDPIALSSAPAATAAPTAASNAVSISQTSSATPSAKASITIKKPAIATMPTGGGENEGLRSSDDD